MQISIESNENKEKVEGVRTGDSISDSVSEDSVISGDQIENQHIHQKASQKGKDWKTYSDNEADQSMLALRPGETVAQYQIRLDERQKQQNAKPQIDSFGIDFGNGTVETARGTVDRSQEVVAWDPLKDVRSGFEKFSFPHRANPEHFYDVEAARYVSQHLPRLSRYSELHEGIAPNLICAIMTNEQTYYHAIKDGIPDAIVKAVGNFPANSSVGPAQMQLKNIEHLSKKYPNLFGVVRSADVKQLSGEKAVATALVGAYLDDRIEILDNWLKNEPDLDKLSKDQKLLLKYAFPLWKSGLQTKALIMSYNPAGGEDHLNNVLKHLKGLKGI